MKMKTIYLVTLVLLSLEVLCGCNDNVFIKRLEVMPEVAEIGPDCPKAVFRVEGELWKIDDVWFSSADGRDYVYKRAEDKDVSIKTPYASLSFLKREGCVEVVLESFLSGDSATAGFTVTDGYEYKYISLKVYPTGTYNIEIISVDYLTESWWGYPDEDFTDKVITYQFPQGFSEPKQFTFPKMDMLPMLYRFQPNGNIDDFGAKVLDSHLKVPVPTYTINEPGYTDFWTMTGEEAVLTTNRSLIEQHFLPPMPPAVELPANKPLEVSLLCDYESIGLSCTINARNPMTDKIETIECYLQYLLPVKFSTEVVTKP